MKIFKRLSACLLLGLVFKANAYYTQQSSIYDNNGKSVTINGLSWSGFQDSNVFQGLQSNPFYTVTLPYSSTARTGLMETLKNTGDFKFKTIRLPIQPGVLYDVQGEVDLNKSLSNKEQPSAGNGIFCQTWQANGNNCEKAVSPQKAFWIALNEMKKNNLKVMIDIHHEYGYGDAKRNGTVYDMAQYEKDLVLLAKEIKERGLDNVIGIDIFNEPYQLNWFKNRNNQVAWTKVIATAAKAIHQTNPDLLLFVEGPGGGNDDADNPTICVKSSDIQDDPNGYAHWKDPGRCGSEQEVVNFKGNWGEDFKPLLNNELAAKGIAQIDIPRLINALYQQVPDLDATTISWLLGDDESGHNGHIAFSPHVYPSEVAGWETAAGNPSNLRFDWSWGFLHKAGFPVVLGEASWKSATGKDFFTQALMPYLLESGIGTHNLYFWAIGYLGDTVSAINPNTGQLDLDVQKTLSPYFN